MSVFYIFIISIILFTVMYVFISSSDNTLLENTKFIISTQGKELKDVIMKQNNDLKNILQNTDDSIKEARNVSKYTVIIRNFRGRLNTISGKFNANHSNIISPFIKEDNRKEMTAYVSTINNLITSILNKLEELKYYNDEEYGKKCYYFKSKVWKGNKCDHIGEVNGDQCGCAFKGGCIECPFTNTHNWARCVRAECNQTDGDWNGKYTDCVKWGTDLNDPNGGVVPGNTKRWYGHDSNLNCRSKNGTTLIEPCSHNCNDQAKVRDSIARYYRSL